MKDYMCVKVRINSKRNLSNGMSARTRSDSTYTIPDNRSRILERGFGFPISTNTYNSNGLNLFHPFQNERQGSSKKLQALCSLTTCDPRGFYNSGEGSSFRKIVVERIEAATKNASGLMITRKLPDYAPNLSGRKRL